MASELLLRSVLAEKCGRFHEMRQFAIKMAAATPHLDTQQRGLLAEAFRKSMGIYRTAIRNLDQAAEVKKDCYHASEEIINYKQELTELVLSSAKEGLAIVHRIAKAFDSDEEIVWIAKTRADLHRYMAEVDSSFVPECSKLYVEADRSARRLRMGHELRLAVLLNHAIFVYDILKEEKRAIKMLQESLDEVPAAIQRKQDTVMRTLMCHNLELWLAVKAN